MSEVRNTEHWINQHIREMISGKDVVIVTTGPAKSKSLLKMIGDIAKEAVCIREHMGEATRRNGSGSIRFAHISTSHLEATVLATSVTLDPDISLGNFRAKIDQ